jgi:hypothetical protein
VLDPLTSGEGVLTVNRDKWYNPRDDEAYRAESYLQVLIHRHVISFFPRVKEVVITSRYPAWDAQETRNPSPEDILKADEFICYIDDQRNGKVELVPRYEKCPNCWWKGCPVRMKGRSEEIYEPNNSGIT